MTGDLILSAIFLMMCFIHQMWFFVTFNPELFAVCCVSLYNVCLYIWQCTIHFWVCLYLQYVWVYYLRARKTGSHSFWNVTQFFVPEVQGLCPWSPLGMPLVCVCVHCTVCLTLCGLCFYKCTYIRNTAYDSKLSCCFRSLKVIFGLDEYKWIEKYLKLHNILQKI